MQSGIIFMLCCIIGLYYAEGKSKPVVAGLNTKWRNTPVLLEASEFMAEESNEFFWKFVDTIVDFQIYNSASSPRVLHDGSVKAATMILGQDKLKLNLLKFSVGLRMYSPKIAMFHQLAEHVAPSDCDIFFDIHGSITCNYKDIDHIVKKVLEDKAEASATFKPDHIYRASGSPPVTIILYADIATSGFKSAHEHVKRMAEDGNCKYVLRHYVRTRPNGKVRMSGYGIELAIKSTEYKAIDDSEVKGESDASISTDQDDVEVDGFDFAALRQLHPNLSSELTAFRDHLSDSTNEIQPMKVWQLQDLSFQAAARVLSSPPEEQMKVLKDISQNFPLRVRSLVKQQVNSELKKEIKKNQEAFGDLDLDAGDSMFLLNGRQIDVSDTDTFELLDILRGEERLISGLKKLQVHGSALQKVMKLNVKSETTENYLLNFKDPSVIWMNDIESDDKYKRWPGNIHELLRPAFPGTLRRIRKNMFHLVIIIDPTHEDAKYIIESAEIFWANDVPVRIGFSFLVNDSDDIHGSDDAGVALVRAFNFARDDLEDSDKSFRFLSGIFKSLSEKEPLTVEHVKSRLLKKFKDADLEDIFGPKSEFDENRKLGKAFYQRAGLSGDVNVLVNGALLSDEEVSSDNFEQSVIEKILDGFPPLQRAAYMGELTNDMVVLDYLLDRKEVVPRFNDRVLASADKLITFLGEPQKVEVYGSSEQFSKLGNMDKTMTVAERVGKLYISKSAQAKYVRPITMWAVANVESKDGRRFVYNAMKHIKSSSLSRVVVIHNLKDVEGLADAKFARAVEAALATLSSNHARNFITKLMKEENAVKLISGDSSLKDFYVGGMDEKAFEERMNSDVKKTLPYIASQSIWSKEVVGLRPGQNAVVVNGKIVGPLNPGELFIAEDFHLVESFVYSSAAEKIEESLKGSALEPPQMSDLIMKLTSHLSSQTDGESERRDISPPHQQHSAIKVASTAGEDSSYEITVILDPTSNKAQEIVPVVMVLQEVLDANVKVFMNCREKLSELPVKRFYRFVLEPAMSFKVDNTHSDGPVARFSDMPAKSILTLTVHPPEGWMVEPVDAIYDLDNIKLEEVASKAVSAEYELEYLVLEGHARDLTSGSPPRGLQFTLGASQDTVAVDTIVMANLGYFQLKANPGVWYLNLREGKSRDIYHVVSHENTEASTNDDAIILMDSFKSKVVIVKVAKKTDKVSASLIEDDDTKPEKKEEDSGGLWSSLANTFSGGSDGTPTAAPSGNSSDVINIFSLASGHLYERLMRIMMLSVISKTETKVKFWVLKNYLSPQFKHFIPYYAKKYGFDYELVQYKWPRWLRQQTEKQRTMWGYKILFLDVLFPLSVDKIIFVDADQIVRADLKELRDLDLEGNPYGYTPFCSDRKEMDGFRFWKGGYWASHLAGRKYHISAIYVVDLKKFRQIAAGDRLRGQYQGLSQDPNSLANLDQDLPNNMIHQVGIKSLPQEWLWCATWCSEESKAKAKTIDLCNNPLTKEPKLQAAVRIAPEWTTYDEEIKALQAQFNGENVTQGKKNEEPPTNEPKKKHQEL